MERIDEELLNYEGLEEAQQEFALMVERRRAEDEQRRPEEERRRAEDERKRVLEVKIKSADAAKLLESALDMWAPETGSLFARGLANSLAELINVCYVNAAVTAFAASPRASAAAVSSLAAAGCLTLSKAVALGMAATTQRDVKRSVTFQRAFAASLPQLFQNLGVRVQLGEQYDAREVVRVLFSRLSLPVSVLIKFSTCTVCRDRHQVDGDAANLRSSLFFLRTDVPSLAEGLVAPDNKLLRCSKCPPLTPLPNGTMPDGQMHTEELVVRSLSPLIAFAFTGAGRMLAREEDAGQQRYYQAPQRLVRRAIAIKVGEVEKVEKVYRLVACCYRESPTGAFSSGHWFTRARRLVDVRVPTLEGGERSVSAGQWLTFNDGAPPEDVDWPTVRTKRPALLLYEEDDSAGTRAELALDVVDEMQPPIQQAQLAPHSHLAIMKEPILFRGGNSKNFSQELLEADWDVVHYLRHKLVEDNPVESTFVYNSQWVLRREERGSLAEGTILCGQCQLGKTTDTLLCAWLAHFVYDTIPIIFVRNAGGGQSIDQFVDAINGPGGFNERIRGWLMASGKKCDPERFFLYGKRNLDDIDEPMFRDGKAQVLFRLTNAVNLRKYVIFGRVSRNVKNSRSGDLIMTEKLYAELHRSNVLWHKKPLSHGKLRATLLFDEGDTTVQSSRLDKAKTERLVYHERLSAMGEEEDRAFVTALKFVLVNAVHYVIHITATPAALFFTARDVRFNAVIMPIKKLYYGFCHALKVDEANPSASHRICVESGRVRIMADSMAVKRTATPLEMFESHPGILGMLTDMLGDASGVQRMGLINAVSEIYAQNSIQDQVLLRVKERPVFVLTHNGGNADSGGFACRLRTSAAVKPEILRMFAESRSDDGKSVVFPLVPASSYQVRQGSSLTRVTETDRTVYFKRAVRVGDILDMIQAASIKVAEEDDGRKPLVFIVTSRMGGRGITYKSRDRKMHLTDEYLHLQTQTVHSQFAIQVASRICGIYGDAPNLRLWCSQGTWRTLDGMLKLEDALVLCAHKAFESGTPLFEALETTNFHEFEHAVGKLRLAAKAVMKQWRGERVLTFGDGTDYARSTEAGVEHGLILRMNKFMGERIPSIDGDVFRAERVASWTPAVIVEHAAENIILREAPPSLACIATELEVIALAPDVLARVMNELRDAPGEYNYAPLHVLLREHGIPESSDLLRATNGQRNSNYSRWPPAYCQGGIKDTADCVYRFAPAEGKLYVIKRRLSCSTLAEALPVDGVRVVIWHSFQTPPNAGADVVPSVQLHAHVEAEALLAQDDDGAAQDEAVDNAASRIMRTLRSTWALRFVHSSGAPMLSPPAVRPPREDGPAASSSAGAIAAAPVDSEGSSAAAAYGNDDRDDEYYNGDAMPIGEEDVLFVGMTVASLGSVADPIYVSDSDDGAT